MNTQPTSSPATPLQRGWWTWAGLTGVSVLGMLVVLPRVDILQINVSQWFVVPLLWLALAVPATVGVYGHCFRREWSADRSVNPADYIRGLTSIWSVLTAGVWLSLGACLLAGSATPGVWPGALMLMLLVLARPSSN